MQPLFPADSMTIRPLLAWITTFCPRSKAAAFIIEVVKRIAGLLTFNPNRVSPHTLVFCQE